MKLILSKISVKTVRSYKFETYQRLTLILFEIVFYIHLKSKNLLILFSIKIFSQFFKNT
jgi:hypothetical protein